MTSHELVSLSCRQACLGLRNTLINTTTRVSIGINGLYPSRYATMKFSILTVLVTSLALVRHAVSEIAPEITTIEKGYNIIAKLPCIGCPFLYQDTSTGRDEPWTERKDENALVNNYTPTLDFPNHPNNASALEHQPPLRFSPSIHQHRPPSKSLQDLAQNPRHPNPPRHFSLRSRQPHLQQRPRQPRWSLLRPLLRVLPAPHQRLHRPALPLRHHAALERSHPLTHQRPTR